MALIIFYDAKVWAFSGLAMFFICELSPDSIVKRLIEDWRGREGSPQATWLSLATIPSGTSVLAAVLGLSFHWGLLKGHSPSVRCLQRLFGWFKLDLFKV